MQVPTTKGIENLRIQGEASDEALVTRAQAGDKEAFLQLYQRYVETVYRRLRSRIPAADLDDLTQDIFIGLMHSLGQFKGQARFSTWLYTIVSRRIADYYRSRQRKNDGMLSLDDTNTPQIASPEELPEDAALLQGAIGKLPEHYREVLLLRFADDLPFAEIAAQKGQSLEAIKSLYRRALQALKQQMHGA
jgi:RNA polymerase sigma-70 factor, ECF subfamily